MLILGLKGLKDPRCLYNSTMYEEQVFYSFIKCIVNCVCLLLLKM